MGTSVKAELKDGTICQMDTETLSLLLAKNEIAKFKRSDGWAVVGRDSLRNMSKGTVYSVPERRA